MKRFAVVSAAICCIFIIYGCAKPGQTREEHTRAIKARMYDLDRKLGKAEEKAVIRGKPAKKHKTMNAQVKKALDKAKADLAALQERVDRLATVTGEAWDGFTADIERGMDGLDNNIEHILGTYKERQAEETQPQ